VNSREKLHETTATEKKKSALIAKAPVFVSTRTLAPEYLISDLLDAFKLVLDQIPEAKPDNWYSDIAKKIALPEVYQQAAKDLIAEGKIR